MTALEIFKSLSVDKQEYKFQNINNSDLNDY